MKTFFDLTPAGIIKYLDLRRPIYRKTAAVDTSVEAKRNSLGIDQSSSRVGQSRWWLRLDLTSKQSKTASFEWRGFFIGGTLCESDLAFRAFWSVLFSKAKALRVQEALSQPIAAIENKNSEPKGTESKTCESSQAGSCKAKRRSDSLASLQREARFLDLVNESLDGFSDDQIGKAARDVLRDSKKVLTRYFAIAPLSTAEEGNQVPIPQGSSLSILHRRKFISREELRDPCSSWLDSNDSKLTSMTGSDEDILVLAPSEIEVS